MKYATRRFAIAGALGLMARHALGQANSNDTMFPGPFDNFSLAKDDPTLILQDKPNDVLTVGFAQLTRGHPELLHLRKSIGLVVSPNSETQLNSLGSSVLLDKFGTVCLSYHQISNLPAKVSFYVGPTATDYVQAKITDIDHKDEAEDFILASISESTVKDFGLSPVAWGKLPHEETFADDIVFVGFEEHNLLHASPGRTNRYENELLARKAHNLDLPPINMYCKILASGNVRHEMSGGGVFYDGKCVGLINTTGSTRLMMGMTAPISHFTPIGPIRAAYVKQYPDRAAKANITMPNTPDDVRWARPGCRFDGLKSWISP